MSVSTDFCSILGIHPNETNAGMRPDPSFLGLRGAFPSDSTDFLLRASLPEGKNAAWDAHIISYLKADMLSYHELEKLIGRMSSLRAKSIEKFATTQIRPLYHKMYRMEYNARLTAPQRACCDWRRDAILSFSPGFARPAHRPLTSGSTQTPLQPRRASAHLFAPGGEEITLRRKVVSSPRAREYLFRDTCLIFGIELLALVAFYGENSSGGPINQSGFTWIETTR